MKRLLLFSVLAISYEFSVAITIELTDGCDNTPRSGCFRIPAGCTPSTSCNAVVKYEHRGDRVHFELGRSNAAASRYVALGFSVDDQMGQDGVSACVTGPSGLPAVVSGYNPATSNNIFPEPPGMYTNIETGIDNGFMVCKFDQIIDPSGLTGDAANYVNLGSQPYHLLLAMGTSLAVDSLSIHSLSPGLDYPKASERIFLTAEVDSVNGPSTSGVTGAGVTLDLAANCENNPLSGCFREPPGCTPASSCVSVVKYEQKGDRVHFELGRRQGGPGKYVAMGFSTDRSMGNDGVTACVSRASGNPQVVAGYNDGKANKLFANVPPDLFSNVQTMLLDGFMVCKFDQKVEPSGLPAEAAGAFNLKAQAYNLLLAVGAMSPSDGLNELSMHSLNPGSEYPKSSEKIYLASTANAGPAVLVTIPPPIPVDPSLKAAEAPGTVASGSGAAALFAGCSIDKGCFRNPVKCSGDACMQLFSYKDAGGNMIEMELARRLSESELTSGGQKYIAIGFSEDRQMGKDFVTACIFDPNSDNPVVRDSYNPAYSNSAKDTLQSDFHLGSTGVLDSYYFCRFKRNAVVLDSQHETVANLSKEHYLLLAAGSASNFNLNKHPVDPLISSNPISDFNLNEHPVDPLISSNPIDVTSTLDAAADCGFLDCNVKSRLVKAHAILMLIGWGFFVPIAILFARYFRNAWPHKMPTGVKTWFLVHRSFNALGWLMFIAAFIIIFVAKQKWVGVTWGSTSMTHAILGLVSTALGFIQPFNALCRCAPTHNLRFIFNWVHRSVGVLGLALALAAIGVAYGFFFFAEHKNATFAVMLLYIVALGVALIALEVHLTITERLKSGATADTGSTQVPMQAYQYDQHGRPVPMYTYSSTSHDASLPYFKSTWAFIRLIILGLFALIAIAVIITLSVFIGQFGTK